MIDKIAEDPNRAVKGKSLNYAELSDWTPEKFISFFDFISFISVYTKEASITPEVLTQIQNHPNKEFLARFDIPFNEYAPQIIARRIRDVVMQLSSIVGRFLKENPGLMTESMLEVTNRIPRFKSLSAHFKVVQTDTGAIVIEPNNAVEYIPQAVKSANAEVGLMEVVLKTTNVINIILDSINPRDIKSMETKDKIAALQKLSFIFTHSKQVKGNTNTFNKINIVNASKDDLEKAVMEFTQQDISNE